MGAYNVKDSEVEKRGFRAVLSGSRTRILQLWQFKAQWKLAELLQMHSSESWFSETKASLQTKARPTI